jgi:MscS family membrane protein
MTGSSLNTLIAFGGISGLALAFASQEVIASFFGGLMTYITQPFVIGDWIILPEKNI